MRLGTRLRRHGNPQALSIEYDRESRPRAFRYDLSPGKFSLYPARLARLSGESVLNVGTIYIRKFKKLSSDSAFHKKLNRQFTADHSAFEEVGLPTATIGTTHIEIFQVSVCFLPTFR
jgi:hypothetical protein